MIEVEKETFSPIFLACTVGAGPLALKTLEKLASNLYTQKDSYAGITSKEYKSIKDNQLPSPKDFNPLLLRLKDT